MLSPLNQSSTIELNMPLRRPSLLNTTPQYLIRLLCSGLCLFKPQLFADNVLSEQPPEQRAFEFQGQSELEYLDLKEGWKRGDVNRFTICVIGCKWKLTLLPLGKEDAQPTEVADDGRNYYIFVRGSGVAGSSLIGNEKEPYFDSATVVDTGMDRPKRHGIAPWLLLRNKCMFSQHHGVMPEIGDRPPLMKSIQWGYEANFSTETNSFGPSSVKMVPVATNHVDLGAFTELVVLSNRKEIGFFLPSSAELRWWRGAIASPHQPELQRVYRVSIDSFKELDKASEIVPRISRPTSFLDERLGEKVEYISDSWKTQDQVTQLMRSGKVKRFQITRSVSTSKWGIGESFILFLILAVAVASAKVTIAKEKTRGK